MTTVLLTGACGFAGPHIMAELLRSTDMNIIAVDSLTYAGDMRRMMHLDTSRIKFLYHDFRQPWPGRIWDLVDSPEELKYIIHNGAESHVSRSLADPKLFVESNTLGTMQMLEFARASGTGWDKIIYTSTDEVLGPICDHPHKETEQMRPSSPYASSKAAGELLCYAYQCSFDLPVVVTRTSNMFGERQHPEKFIPRVIRTILRDEQVTVHSGERAWLYVGEQAQALTQLLKCGVPGEIYHLAGTRRTNFDMAYDIAQILEKTLWAKMKESDRSSYDMGYWTDDSKLRTLCNIPHCFGATFRETVLWTAAHSEWLED